MPGAHCDRLIPVSWGDCDAAGVVFYARYYAWFDAGTHALLESVGLGQRVLQARHGILGLPVLTAEAQFRSPATYGDSLEARCEVVEMGRCTMRLAHRLRVGERLVCEGSELRIWAVSDPQAPHGMRGAPIPEAVRASLRPLG